MKIPKKIHFAGHTYKVIEVTKLDGEANWGRTNVGEETEIRLEKKMATTPKEEVFLHELMHIAHRSSTGDDDYEKQEKLIKPLARNLYGILKDNNLLK